MKRTIRELCSKCGSKNIGFNSILWQRFAFKDYKQGVLITKSNDLSLVQCNDCKEHFFNRKYKDAQRLDEAIKQSIKDQWTKYLKKILERQGINQKELGDSISMTPEQISRVKSGKEIPSHKTFLLIKILASSPEAFRAIHAPGDINEFEQLVDG